MIADEKRRLRKEARARRDAFVAATPLTQWYPPANHFGREFDRGVPIASYRAKGSEADPTPIELIARQAMMFISYPRIDDDGVMRFYSPGPSGEFVHDRFGVETVARDGWLHDPCIILVPMLAFDRTGTRLGQGGGHYDRALATAELSMKRQGQRLLKVGIAWSIQEMVALPREPWDVALDGVLTEKEWISI
jgi:5-formyltetrahydrofolate cyclo-ligase